MRGVYSRDRKKTIGSGVSQIIPPTSQNQHTIEEDLRHFAESRLSLSDEELQWQCEQTIRNYDPCISCATHFLKLEIERE